MSSGAFQNRRMLRAAASFSSAAPTRIVLKDILAALDHAPVLTVSDIADFSKRGGMIEFLMKGNYIRFAINRTTAEDAGLVLDSDLLKVAIAVWQSGGRGGR